jgi:Resolvase, N terminal domain
MPRISKTNTTEQSDRIQRVVGYARVSTRRQAEHALSLAEQERKIGVYCEANNFELLDLFVDAGLTGTTAKRPNFQRMMEFAAGSLSIIHPGCFVTPANFLSQRRRCQMRALN